MSDAPVRDRVFISYCHDDRRWLEDFQRMLRPAVNAGVLDLWSDQRLATGGDWRRQIEDALASARVALLLVSDSFLASNFITQYELPTVLLAAQNRGLSVLWVPISASLFEQTELAKIQACWDPALPLDRLSEPECGAAIKRICLDLCSRLGQASRVLPSEIDRLRDAAQRQMPAGVLLRELVASGSSSVVFRAEQADSFRPLAVKVLVGSPLDERASEDVAQQARIATELEHPVFIKIHQAVLRERPHCLITDYVTGAETLAHALETGGAFSVERVQIILHRLCEAFAEAHARGLFHVFLKASNILLQGPIQPRLSAFGFWTFIARNADRTGDFVVNREMLSYMTPESFYGWPLSPRTDQYALGLIALEMLEGTRRVTVRLPVDMILKQKFFADPFPEPPAWERRHPVLGRIVRGMLRERPDDRWASLADVMAQLERMEREAVVLAKSSYRECCRVGSGFYEAFYARLFADAPELAPMFAGRDMAAQYRLLDTAVQGLLNFPRTPVTEPTVLSAVAERHAPLGLTPRHFDAFGAALLAVLRDRCAQPEEVIEAWRSTISPGLEYMKSACPRSAPAATQ